MSAAPPAIPLRHRVAAHCGSGAFRDLLEHAGLSYGQQPLSEAMTFGLGGGIGLRYEGETAGASFPFCLMGRELELETVLCRNLGIEAELVQTDDPRRGWELLREEIDRGRPALVWTDSSQLPYLREVLSLHVENTRHALIVLGYDSSAGVAYVADQYFKQPQACELGALAEARCSDRFPGPNRHALWRLSFPSRLPPAEVAVRVGVARTVLGMGGHGRGDADATEPYGGFEALERLGRRCDSLEREGAGAEARRWLRFWIRQAGTGGALFRSLQADFLAEAAGLLDDPHLRRAAQAYAELGENWVTLARELAKPDFPDPGTLPLALDAIGALEREAIERLGRWLYLPSSLAPRARRDRSLLGGVGEVA
jgi:Butirosin biosynthesis protein H, N-terminal/Domain of unknown function (DUF4872)